MQVAEDRLRLQTSALSADNAGPSNSTRCETVRGVRKRKRSLRYDMPTGLAVDVIGPLLRQKQLAAKLKREPDVGKAALDAARATAVEWRTRADATQLRLRAAANAAIMARPPPAQTPTQAPAQAPTQALEAATAAARAAAAVAAAAAAVESRPRLPPAEHAGTSSAATPAPLAFPPQRAQAAAPVATAPQRLHAPAVLALVTKRALSVGRGAVAKTGQRRGGAPARQPALRRLNGVRVAQRAALRQAAEMLQFMGAASPAAVATAQLQVAAVAAGALPLRAPSVGRGRRRS